MTLSVPDHNDIKLYQWLSSLASLKSISKEHVRNVFTFASFMCSYLWKARIELYFNQKSLSHVDVILRAKRAYKDYLEANSPPINCVRSVSHNRFVDGNSKWSPPPAGWVKINTDTTLRKDTNQSGIGFTIKFAKGDIILAASKQLPFSSVVVGEALALPKGLLAAIEAGFINIIMESDCLKVVSLYSNASQSSDIYVCSILEDIKPLSPLGRSYHLTNRSSSFARSSGESSNEVQVAFKDRLDKESEERQLDKVVQESIFVDVMGRDCHGRVCLMGLGVTLKELFGTQTMR
ncbi:hypothetical protein NE237_033243 [Protea cynaroides]|uniref:RNase H type-1 domain-containing protein n=1 Tax=Protea cynaroides TaxID=273540 RepID=A0A9Q0L551_9MAGN|nr:hypothetical protein NE237_033243 [Protea cynaroides]